MKKDFDINYRGIPILSIAFTRSTGLLGRLIQAVRGGLTSADFPNHVLIITEDHRQLFATEETGRGLVENSLEEYSKKQNRIVSMFRWNGWGDSDHRRIALEFLAEIRRRHGEESKYDFRGLLSFVPGIKRFIKPDPRRQWCSENVASLHKRFGCDTFMNVHIAPDKMLELVRADKNWIEITGFYC